MKKFLLGIFSITVSLISAAQVRPAPAPVIDITGYQFDLRLSDKTDSIYGKAIASFTCLADTKQVVFDLRQSDGKTGFSVSSVRMDNTDLAFEQVKDRILVNLAGKGHKNEKLSLAISYSGIPADGLIISTSKFGKRTFFADNWPNRAHQWLPCVDDPADKASVEFNVTAPAHYKVIANGVLAGEEAIPGEMKRTSYKEPVPLPTKIMVIGVADFSTEQSGMVGSIPVSTWVFPENRQAGFRDYGIAPPILQWMQEYIGPFPYKKLAHVQSKTIFGGMENAGAIFYYENSVNGKADNEALIAHETAHQFFGDMVTEKDFSHIWLSEGFATYMTHLYLESRYGTDSLAKAMARDRNQVIAFSRSKRLPVIDTVSKMMDLLSINSYQKGSWVLHMLRRETGDSLFRLSLREYYRSFAGKNATSSDLRTIFEKVSHRSLDNFFRQWLEIPGQPDLDIRWTYISTSQQFQLTIRQQQQQLFTFPIEFEIRLKDNSSQLIRLEVARQEQVFVVPLKAEPISIHADPKTSLLFTSVINPK